MKSFLILITIIFFSISIKAQQSDIFKRKPWEEYKLKRALQDTLKPIFPVPAMPKNRAYTGDVGVLKLPLKGRFIGENSNGDEIYAMETDQMPCVVPGKKFKYTMPIAGISKNDKNYLPLLQKGEKKPGNLDEAIQDK